MERQLKWDLYYLRVAAAIATASKDPSTKVGAVLVRPWGGVDNLPGNRIAATGFNGFPEGMDDHPDLYANREYKYKHVVHAEVAAFQALGEQPTPGFTLYTSFPCCEGCIEFAHGRGVRRIVSSPICLKGRSLEWAAEWAERIKQAGHTARKLGVTLETVRV